jgi:molecular chaperone GrpE
MTRSPRDLAAQKVQLRKEQERLFQDLLGILDALDHACEHWQQAEQAHIPAPSPSLSEAKTSWWQWLTPWRRHQPRARLAAQTTSPAGVDAMAEVLSSAYEGVEMIRRSLLEILNQYQVRPLDALGQPFDPTTMYAVARQASEGAPANTVVQEVVRGYLWQDRILREAQVIVAAASELMDDEADADTDDTADDTADADTRATSSGRGTAPT